MSLAESVFANMRTNCDGAVAAGIAKFGLTLFALLAEDALSNVVLISPLSISAALSLAMAGCADHIHRTY